MIVLVVGLSIIAVFAADLAGGAGCGAGRWRSKDLGSSSCPSQLHRRGDVCRRGADHDAGLHPAAGRVPARDVGQGRQRRKTGAVIGGFSYILFAFVPMFIVAGATVVMGEQALDMAQATTTSACCPASSWAKMPLVMQILFFGALLSAIKSTSSATLLAPVDQLRREHPQAEPAPGMGDRQRCWRCGSPS